MSILRLKTNSIDSVSIQNGAEDTGPSTVLPMTTAQSLLSASLMESFIALRAVLDDTSIRSLDIKFVTTEEAFKWFQTVRATLRMYGWSLDQSNTQSRESQPLSSTNSDGGSGLTVTSVSREGSLSRISMSDGTEWSSTRYDTQMDVIDDLALLEDAARRLTEWNVSRRCRSTCAGQREVETPSFSECAEFLQSQFPQLQVRGCSEGYVITHEGTGLYRYVSPIEMTQGRNSWQA